jgi:hypothetical protein
MEKSKEPQATAGEPKKSFAQSFVSFSEVLLHVSELWSVAVLVTVTWLVSLGTAIWIAGYPTQRLPLVLGNLNNNWKACLLLLVPLFYRTMKSVLRRIKKWPGGMESQEAEASEIKTTKSEAQKHSPEEES